MSASTGTASSSAAVSNKQENSPAPPGAPAAAAPKKKGTVVGIYGVSGSGKSYLLHQLKQKLGQDEFVFYDGSEAVAKTVNGGMAKFNTMPEPLKDKHRAMAIDNIGDDASRSGRVAVVAGHLMFWEDEKVDNAPNSCTPKDWEVYTHMLYPDIPAETIYQRRVNDIQKDPRRPHTSAAHLGKWQIEEQTRLRKLCRQHCILFTLVSSESTDSHKEPVLDRVQMLLRDFQKHNEEYNLACAKRALDNSFAATGALPKTMLVFDADKTLAQEDSGLLFFSAVPAYLQSINDQNPLKTLFDSPFGFSYAAFRQAMLMYEEAAPSEQAFDDTCTEVAAAVHMHPEFISLLQYVVQHEHVLAVVVSSGLRLVWSKVLETEHLSTSVRVIAGGRIADDFVITGTVKEALVSHLQSDFRTPIRVWAFGDSPLDLPMLCQADRAIVVAGDAHTHSKSMDAKLAPLLDDHTLLAHQMLFPRTAPPRLGDSAKNNLPVLNPTSPDFAREVFGFKDGTPGLRFVHPAPLDAAAKLLATDMRDARVGGPALRAAHQRAGHYLALRYLGEVIGLEDKPIRHVLGRAEVGARFFHEERTLVVALMRGGEPMALGVSEAMPGSVFVHAKEAEDVRPQHVAGMVNVLLVDSVVNTGATVVEFVQRVRKLHGTVRIVVVAGGVQKECVREGGKLFGVFRRQANLTLVGLRVSETKFKGAGATDTGNRLFNTVHLD